MIHMAITRTVRPGREDEFELKIHEFFQDAQRFPGTAGVYLLRPVHPEDRTYGIMRAFEDEAARDAFYASQLFKDWSDAVAPLVEGEPTRRALHGLEAFFRGEQAPPAAWKMAIVTWIGVNPAVFIFSKLVPSVFGELPGLAELLLVNACVVASLTWFFMPILTRLFKPLLQSKGSSST